MEVQAAAGRLVLSLSVELRWYLGRFKTIQWLYWLSLMGKRIGVGYGDGGLITCRETCLIRRPSTISPFRGLGVSRALRPAFGFEKKTLGSFGVGEASTFAVLLGTARY